MINYSRSPKRLRLQSGFTLTELAIVLIIVALLISGMLVPLSAQKDMQDTNETQKQLAEIREALLGFAVMNKRLPCPDTDTDPSASGYGLEEPSCASSMSEEGFLPWKTLGVSAMDAWGTRRTVASSPRLGDWRYRVDRNFANSTSLISLTTSFSTDSLVIQDHGGINLTSTTERPVAIVFSTGPNHTPDGQNSSYEGTSGTYEAGERTTGFDDIVVWISRPVLFNRLIAAGRLP